MNTGVDSLVQPVFLSAGGVLVVVSMGAFWRVRRRTQQSEPALLRQLLVRYILYGGFLLLVPSLQFLLHPFFRGRAPCSFFCI